MKTLKALGLVLLAIGLAGCVASSKYNKLMAETTALQSEQAKLQQQTTQLAEENAKLQANVEKLQAEADALVAARDALEKEHTAAVTKYDEVVNQLSQEVSSGALQIKQYQNMLSVNVAEQLFFASGSATIKPGGKKVLLKVGEALAQYPDKIIRVVGHTDNVPIAKSSAFASNWELSAMRATTVVRFLQDQCKLTPERLIASGRGPFEPVAANDTPEGRQKNRRIEIWLLDKSMMESMRAASPSE